MSTTTFIVSEELKFFIEEKLDLIGFSDDLDFFDQLLSNFDFAPLSDFAFSPCLQLELEVGVRIARFPHGYYFCQEIIPGTQPISLSSPSSRFVVSEELSSFIPGMLGLDEFFDDLDFFDRHLEGFDFARPLQLKINIAVQIQKQPHGYYFQKVITPK